MEFWHLKFPDRYQREKASLISLGATFNIDEELLLKGIVKIDCELLPSEEFEFEQHLNLTIVYPDLYPFFRPTVIAPNLDLARHQNPQGKNLCLLPRSTIAWELDWTIGDLLRFQLQKVLTKGVVTDSLELEKDHEEQAEPISEYYSNSPQTVLFDSTVFKDLDPTEKNSKFLGKVKVGLPLKAHYPTSLAILKVTYPNGLVDVLAPEIISENYPKNFEGSLYYIPEFVRPEESNAFEKLRLLMQSSERPFVYPRLSIKLEEKSDLLAVIGFAFPEEIAPGQFGIGWIFFTVGGKKNKQTLNYLRVLRLNRTGHELRVPKVAPLVKKTVGIIGLGALGGPLAIELAKNGIGKLKLLDFDLIDPGTTIRWPLGISEAGNKKTEALANFINKNYPSTIVEIFSVRLGDPSDKFSENQVGLLEKFFEKTSLIIDASAEGGIHSLVDYESRSRDIPYVIVSATSGGFGGEVIRRIPGVTSGCYVCLQHWYEDKENPIKFPPEEKTDRVQAAGCGDITFTGSSFDLAEISLAGVRMAISALCYLDNSGYNLLPYDVGILSLVDEAGLFDFPKWETHILNKHPKCISCSSTD